jgi:UDP-N-acetylglucosamine 2-epimerase (non-hydrolysing)
MGISREKILSAFEKIMTNSWKTGQKPQFWDGNAAERITALIIRRQR